MADFNQLVIEKSIEHWPVFAGVAGMLFAMWKWIVPNAVRLSLENGGGDAVRAVVKSELHSQDERIEEKLQEQDDRFDKKLQDYENQSKERLLEVITKHEEVERITIQNVLLKLKNETDHERTKLNEVLGDIDERATHIERKLKMKRRERVKKKISEETE